MRKLQEQWRSLREVFELVWSQSGDYVKVRLLLTLLLIVGVCILTGLGPVALKLLVDHFNGHSEIPGLPIFPVWGLIAFYVTSQWFARSVGELRGVIYARAERRMMRQLSERLFTHVMRLPLHFHLERRTGAISQTLDNGLAGYQMVLHTLVFTMLPVFAQLATILLVLLYVGLPAFLALFSGATVAYALVFTYSAMTTSAAAHKASRSQVDANAILTDCVLNYETVKYFTAEDVARERVGDGLRAAEIGWVRFYRRYAFNGIGVATIFALFLGVSVWHAAVEVQAGRMTVGTFILVNTYMLQVMRPVELFGYGLQSLSQGLVFLEQLLQILHQPAEAAEDAAVPMLTGPGRLEFDRVGVSYHPERPVLSDISFKLTPGKTVGIVGGSGAGKSTLLRLIMRLMEPSSGRILRDGVPLAEISVQRLRQTIAVVPQDPVMFNDTVAFNISLGRSGNDRAAVEEAARRARLHDYIASLPQGYETNVGERGIKLSGGEKQRLAIARAIFKAPDIYLFDEATSSLDSQTELEILSNLREISRFNTTLIIAHRLSTVIHADEILVLDGGRIVERGTHASLVRQTGRYALLWEAQQQGNAAA